MPEESSSPQPTSSGGGGDDKLVAAISYIGIISVIVLLVKKDSDYVQFHAKQGTVLFIAEVVWALITTFLWFLLLIGSVVWLVFLVATVLGFIKAYSGERYKMPLIGDLATKINL